MTWKKLAVNEVILPAAIIVGIGVSIMGCRDQPGNNASDPGVTVTNSSVSGEKDLTLLHGDPCRQTDSLPERIKRLKREIGRGEAVYTREELTLLERKLADAEADLRVIQHP